MSEYQDQIQATLAHADGAVMAYDILGARHFATNQIPIVLIGGLSSLRGDWERLAHALSEIRPGKQLYCKCRFEIHLTGLL